MTQPIAQAGTALKRHTVSFSDAAVLPPLVRAYLDNDPAINGLYQTPFTVEGILASMPRKKIPAANRATLVSVLQKQYSTLPASSLAAVQANIGLLEKENTYTVTTGHQLNIFSGPLYMLYKLASVIHLANTLKEADPGNNFVPVYWMASEDHDFAEINHVNLPGRKVEWQGHPGGAAGRMICQGFNELIAQAEEVLEKSPQVTQFLDLLRTAYADGRSLSEAMRYFIHGLFGQHGLVILDPDVPELKSYFASVMVDDALQHTANKEVSKTITSLEQRFKAQVHPREINLFYLDENFRGRIEQQGEEYSVLGKEKKFTAATLESEIRANPERFSPNVVLRPLYQEMVLPNLAVVGGPAEISYWLEYKSMFDHYGVAFPCLVLRGMALVLDKSLQARMAKLGLGREDLFKPADVLTREFITRNGDTGFIEEARQRLQAVYDFIAAHIAGIDPTLKASAEGEKQKGLKSVQALEEKAVKALKRKNETAVAQLEKLKAALFPGGVLQERVDSFLPFYARYGQDFIDALVEGLDPMQKKFFVFESE